MQSKILKTFLGLLTGLGIGLGLSILLVAVYSIVEFFVGHYNARIPEKINTMVSVIVWLLIISCSVLGAIKAFQKAKTTPHPPIPGTDKENFHND